MGQNTDVLMQTCSKLADALEPLAKKIAGEIKQINERTATLQKTAVPRQGEKLLRKSDVPKWQLELKEIKSDRNVLAKDLGSLQNSALRNATKAAKDLESKIKKKDFLNFFKTQQSLDNAKKALKQSQQAIDKTEERLTAFNASYADIDGRCDTVTDFLKKSLKGGLEENGLQLRPSRHTVNPDRVQEITDSLTRHLTKTIPNGLVLLKSFQALADKKTEVVKKLGSQIGKTKTWAGNTRQAMIEQLQDEFEKADDGLNNIYKLQRDITFDLEPLSNNPRTRSILSDPVIRQLIKRMNIAEASAFAIASTAKEKLEWARLDFSEMQKDLAAAGNDDNSEDILEGVASIRERTEAFEEMPLAVKVADIDDCKSDLSFLLKLAKERDPVTGENLEKLNTINLNHGQTGKIKTADWVAQMNQFKRAVEGLSNRFKKNTEILKACSDFKTAFKASTKTTETFAKMQEEIYKRSSKLMEKTLSSK